MLCMLACAVIFALAIGPSALRWAVDRVMDEDGSLTGAQAEAALQEMFQRRWGIELTPIGKILAYRQGGRDTSLWFLFRIGPSAMDRIKAQLIARRGTPNPDEWVVNETDDLATFPFYPSDHGAPPWWRPQDVPDKDVLSLRHSYPDGRAGNGYWFVFSRKTGLVYVFEWSS